MAMGERLRLLGKAAVFTVLATGAGYAGAEINRALHTPTTPIESPTDNTLILPGYPGAARWALDIWDRYVMTNERLNRLALVNDITDKNQDRQIQELQEHTGIHLIKPTPRPRPTASERLKPMVTPTP